MRACVFAGVAGAALATSSAAWAACQGSGVITRIAGRPQDVVITRTEDGRQRAVARPRVLEVICQGDLIRVNGASVVTLSVDGRGQVRVDARAPFTVPARAGRASMAGNAYRTLNEAVMPDMRRLAWDVRLKGEDDDFGFALPTLAAGTQTLRAGTRDLLVRLVGGSGPYKVELVDGSGRVAATGEAAEGEVLIRGAALTPGAYKLRASHAGASRAEADVRVVSEAPPVENLDGPEDPEVRAAISASALAAAHPNTWALEAQQIIASAPANGLDRERVYQLVESYGVPDANADEPSTS